MRLSPFSTPNVSPHPNSDREVKYTAGPLANRHNFDASAYYVEKSSDHRLKFEDCM